jgi:hypothetical protein
MNAMRSQLELLKNRRQIIRRELISEIEAIIASAKEKAIRSVDFERVVMYWHLGRKNF